jgi:hypothetical protein
MATAPWRRRLDWLGILSVPVTILLVWGIGKATGLL